MEHYDRTNKLKVHICIEYFATSLQQLKTEQVVFVKCVDIKL